MVKTITTAKCMNCDKTGSTQAWAEKHTKDTGHGTVTSEIPVYEEQVVEEVPEVKSLEEDEATAGTPEDAPEESESGETAAPASDG